MGLLTIGAFARAARLSPKALRLYDELGLLRPAEVDQASGYRFYEPAQLERARLVATLRRLGMPLARILLVCDAGPAEAAAEVAAYWDQVLAQTAARSELAAFLVDYLCGRATAMSDAHATLGVRFAAGDHIGNVRSSQEDRAYAGSRVLAVADGLGGHPGGERASQAVIDALRELERGDLDADPLAALGHAIAETGERLRGMTEADPSLEGLGTTVTALLWAGSRLALVHIGDSRAYLLRDGELVQLTQDHTYVQSLISEGKLSAEEAAAHPRRRLLVRALDGVTDPQADLSLHPVRAGDRYLLCTDGLHAVVPSGELLTSLAGAGDPVQAVGDLVGLANAAGGPDNIGCAVADVIELQL